MELIAGFITFYDTSTWKPQRHYGKTVTDMMASRVKQFFKKNQKYFFYKRLPCFVNNQSGKTAKQDGKRNTAITRLRFAGWLPHNGSFATRGCLTLLSGIGPRPPLAAVEGLPFPTGFSALFRHSAAIQTLLLR
jgi:hypothetical protein